MSNSIAVMPMNGQAGGQNGRKRRDNEGAYLNGLRISISASRCSISTIAPLNHSAGGRSNMLIRRPAGRYPLLHCEKVWRRPWGISSWQKLFAGGNCLKFPLMPL